MASRYMINSNAHSADRRNNRTLFLTGVPYFPLSLNLSVVFWCPCLIWLIIDIGRPSSYREAHRVFLFTLPNASDWPTNLISAVSGPASTHVQFLRWRLVRIRHFYTRIVCVGCQVV